MYLVKYSTGSYEDYREHTVFVTKDKKTAEKYVKKLKDLVVKVNEYYDFMKEKYGEWTDAYYENVCMDRKYTFEEFNNAYFHEIDVR